MTRGFVLCLTAGLVFGLCLPGVAQEKRKKNADAGQQVFQLPKEITLSAEQQAKLDELKKEYGPKLAELQKKASDILTEEQKKARTDAQAKAKSEKLKAKDAREALLAALKLTPEQQAKWDAVQKEIQTTTQEVRGKIAGFLTEEQKAKAPNLVPKGKKKAA